MRVNGIDVRTFKARQLNVDWQPPADAVNYDWNDGDLKPNVYGTAEEKAGQLSLTLYFKDKSRNDVRKRISEFLMQLHGAAELDLEGYEGVFYGMKKSAKVEKTLEPNKKKLSIVLDGFFMDMAILKEVKHQEQVFKIKGTRKSPCTVRMKNVTDQAKEITIEGLTEKQITVNVPPQKEIVIDGENGLVTMDGENAFLNIVEMWEFPFVPQGEVTVKVNDVKNVKTSIEYRPMWL